MQRLPFLQHLYERPGETLGDSEHRVHALLEPGVGLGLHIVKRLVGLDVDLVAEDRVSARGGDVGGVEVDRDRRRRPARIRTRRPWRQSARRRR